MNPTLFDMLARRDDPITSHLAAQRVNLTLTGAHRWLLDWLQDRTATEDEMAAALVDAALVVRHERGRRVARTLRERHDAIVAVLDDAGEQQMRLNKSGRFALVWEISRVGRELLDALSCDPMLGTVHDSVRRSGSRLSPCEVGWWVSDGESWFGPFESRDDAVQVDSSTVMLLRVAEVEITGSRISSRIN